MELVDHSALGFLKDNGGGSTPPPPREVSDLFSQDSYGGYEEAEHCLEMGKTSIRRKTPSSKDFRGNINGLVQGSGNGSSVLSFQRKNEGASRFMWRDQEDVICYGRTEGGFGSLLPGDVNTSPVGWLYSEATMASDYIKEPDLARGRGMTPTQKRPYMGENSTVPKKKQCISGASKSSPSSSKPTPASSSSNDPQSVAAKNRRERISERLKVLQDLVPNGNKVDLVTMLEKAISYVKFLQLQVKVLATDEFWPAQGGKAPDIAQVKEAIDSILSSQRSEMSSSSK